MLFRHGSTHGSSSCSLSVVKQEQKQDVWRAKTFATDYNSETLRLSQQDQTQILEKQFSLISSDLASKYLQTNQLLKKLELEHELYKENDKGAIMMQRLSEQEMLDATIAFLELYYSMTKPDESGILMNSLIRYKKNMKPIDNDKTIWKDWQDCIEAFSNNKIGNEFLESDAFEIFEDFLEKFFYRTNSDDIGSFLSDIGHIEYGYTADPAAAYDWQDCLDKVKKNKLESN